MAIDLRPHQHLRVRGQGMIVSEPSVVAVDTETGNVHAMVEPRMIGLPASISTVGPCATG